jgi:type IV pilus assembly protein PilZ
LQEKRVHPRAPIEIAATCEGPDQTSFAGIIKDISMGGMYIEAAEVPVFASKLTIVCQPPGAPAPMRLPAVVRWLKPGGFGVQFGLLGARETHLIARVVRR